MRWSTRLAIVLGVLVGAAFAITYGWTFTRLGRLDYRAAVIAKMAALSDGPMDMSPAAREAANALATSMLPDNSRDGNVRFEDRVVESAGGGSIPVRIYTPARPRGTAKLPFYLDIHGGGFWMGNGFPFHDLMLDFAESTEAIVVSVDYRLAPEHPYPAALEDCETVLRWIAGEGEALGGDPSRIAIGGASAGGNLAASLAIKMRDDGGPRIAFQYLEVPATDLSGTRDWISYDEAGTGYVLTVEGLGEMIEAYVPEPRQRMDPYVSPLLEGDLSGLPQAFVVTALFDPLRDQGEAYAHRLADAGVPVDRHREEGALHGFMGSPERANRIHEMAAAKVRAALYASSGASTASR